LRSLVELKDVATTGATDLYFGPSAPAGKEGQWIETNPGKGWFAYFRLYGPEGPAFNGSWKPGDFEVVVRLFLQAASAGGSHPQFAASGPEPLCRPLGKGLWEVRSDITDGRIARVLFCIHDGRMVLLHAFIKKTQKTPDSDIELATKRRKDVT
jgi:hypothetical protein